MYIIVAVCLDSLVNMLYDVESPGTRAKDAASDYTGGYQESPATHCTANQTHQSSGICMYLQVIHSPRYIQYSTRVLIWHAIFYYVLHANVLYLPVHIDLEDCRFETQVLSTKNKVYDSV